MTSVSRKSVAQVTSGGHRKAVWHVEGSDYGVWVCHFVILPFYQREIMCLTVCFPG